MSHALKALLRRRNLGLLLVVALVLGTSAVAVGGVPHQKDSNDPYKYFGDASDAVDPMNSDNDVIKVDTKTHPNTPSGVGRKMNETIPQVTDQIELKYLFTDGRTDCEAGSPRVTLFLDTNGDHKWDHFVNGYVHYNGGCAHDEWQYVDMANMADQERRWTDGNSNTVVRWSDIVAEYPTATVVYGQLVDDSQQFDANDQGTAYYDLVSMGNHTFTEAHDAN